MKFKFKENRKEDVFFLLRKCGYHYLGKNTEKNDFSFVRYLSPNQFPRFHIYVKENNGIIEGNIHLDQKKGIYRNSKAHSGEYDGSLLEEEIKRIKQIEK